MMTPEEREAIRKRCEAATAGPWEWKDVTESFLFGPESMWVGEVINRELPEPIENSKHDVEFIAHARTDIPALLSALDEAEKRIASLERTLGDARNIIYSFICQREHEGGACPWCGEPCEVGHKENCKAWEIRNLEVSRIAALEEESK